MNDDFLYKFRKTPRREFAAALYQRITKPMKTTSRMHALRALALAFSMLAIFAGVLFFSPPTRAMADSVIRRIGGIIFVQATPQPGPANNGKDIAAPNATVSPEGQATMQAKKSLAQEATVSPEGQATMQAKERQRTNDNNNAQPALDANAVSQLVGFTVLAPAYLPDGYTATSGGWRVSQENDPGVAAISRINGKGGLEGVSGGAVNNYVNRAAGNVITIEELKLQQSQPKTVDSPQIQDVTVRGQAGVWMPDTGGMNILAWEENGITYLVVGNRISKDEALKVAESLGK